MSKKIKTFLLLTITICTLLFVILLIIGNYLVDFAIVRKTTPPSNIMPEPVVTSENDSIIANNETQLLIESDLWVDSTVIEKTSITSYDGLNLVGNIYWTDPNSHKWLIGVHGYTGQKEYYRTVACQYAKEGYNVLLPDMRSHGESEGTYIGMGWLEKKDMLQWIDLIICMDSDAEIILHGTSMGGATVMMVSGEVLPNNVKGIIEDCGYTSVWDIFADEMQYLFGLPTFPILNVTELVANIRAGYTFREASSIEQIKKAQIPILFIHGSEDNFVRTEMVYDLYDVCPTTKDILVVEGAGHGQAHQINPKLYFETVFTFIDENCMVKDNRKE